MKDWWNPVRQIGVVAELHTKKFKAHLWCAWAFIEDDKPGLADVMAFGRSRQKALRDLRAELNRRYILEADANPTPART